MNDTIEEQQQDTATQQEAETDNGQKRPGARLREAREAAGMSPLEVSSQMRLNERMFSALEADDYETFPSMTFVKGYLRSYARILGLPEEEFVKQVSEVSESSVVSSIGSSEQASSSDLPVRLVTYLLIAAVLISVGMWWFSRSGEVETFTTDPRSELVESEANTDLPLNEQPLSEPQDGSETGADSETPGTVVAVDGEEAQPVAVVPTEQQPAAEEKVANTEQSTPAPKPPVTSRAKPAAAPITAATPVSTIELRYQADSWTEVTDSAGRNLAYGLVKAGETLKLKGEAPFRVFLGYAHGVTVYYNDDLFDHSPFQRRNVARFRVGRAEHNLPGPR